MKVDLGIWSRLMMVVVALVAAAILLFIGMMYLPLIHQNEQYRRRIDTLDAELEKQRLESKRLQAEFDALRSDPKTVERLARETLGYARTDETVIRFEMPVTNVPVR
jgi:cell division protein FtsB